MPGSSRFVVKARPEAGALQLQERELPALGPGDALIEVEMAAICGTDLHLYKWNDWAASTYRPPFPLGHEFCGRVIDIGADVRSVNIGDRVTAETHIACGHCHQCRLNRRHTCQNLRLFSKLGSGCFSRHTVLPALVLRQVPQGVTSAAGALMEPFGVSVRAVMDTDIRARSLLVTGCGPIGLFAILAARAMGAETIVAVDPQAYRRELAIRSGATSAVESNQESVQYEMRRKTNGIGFGTAIDTSGNADAIRSAMAALMPGGSLVVASLPERDVGIDITRQVVLREIRLRGVYGRLMDETWVAVEALMRRGVDPAALVTHAFGLEHFDEAFSVAASGQSGKVIFDMTL